MLIDKPWVSNCEIAKQVGVAESCVRKWKKQPIWEETRTRILRSYAEVMKPMSEQEKNQLKEKLIERQKELEIFRNAQKENMALSYKLSNQAYRELINKEKNQVKACSEATRSGVHIQSKNAMDGLRMLMLIDENDYQLNLLIQDLENDEDENSDRPD